MRIQTFLDGKYLFSVGVFTYVLPTIWPAHNRENLPNLPKQECNCGHQAIQ